MLDLDDKVILLTGASSGIGAATAGVLGAAGAHVVAHYRSDQIDRAGADAALASVPADRKLFLAADFAVPRAADELWQASLAWRGRIDVVVLNAAITKFSGGIEDDEASWEDAWSSQWQINVMAPARLMRAAVPHFKSRGGGIFITFSSWNAQRGSTSPKQIAYAASKGALKAAAQTIARGYARDRILSYIIAPGIVRTKMSEDFAALQGGEEKVTATLAMGEWVPPIEIAHLVAFLATGKSRHLSGATLDVNGATYVR